MSKLLERNVFLQKSAGKCFSQLFGTEHRRKVATHFGFAKVDEVDKKERVRTVFANVATKYDLMNDAMSLGIHRLWKDYFVQRLNLSKDSKVLDMAGGTGDVAFRILNRMRRHPMGAYAVTVADINENMLEIGSIRASTALPSSDLARLSWVRSDAENLTFEDNSYDLYTISFGIRNCTHIEKVLSEAYRVLKPNGVFACLEFGLVDNAMLRRIYDVYSFQFIPVLGQLLVGDFNSYKYLVETMLNGFTSRAFTTSNIRSLRFRSQRPQSELRAVGKLVTQSDAPYERGQCFIHKLFAYRGIIVRTKRCTVFTKRFSDMQTLQEAVPFYQVLIDKEDWSDMNFKADMTTYLKSTGNREETAISGMDIVSHDEILPFEPSASDLSLPAEGGGERAPIKHYLYDQLFKKKTDETKRGDSGAARSRPEDEMSWIFPIAVTKQTTESVEVQVSTFNLGTNTANRSHCPHNWRIVLRVESSQNSTMYLRNAVLKVSSMSGEKTVSDWQNLYLTPTKPALQLSTNISLPYPKGNNLWGKIHVQDEEGRKYELSVPAVLLENNSGISEHTEIIH
uniref:2-methoxy-6-polyprenyl-1,4-benzoquinol methylase, mitochondrial n=1 Tax=Globodera rostochiensis TaxID=31243 RepID=A0A914HEE2_GLORO